MLLHVLCKLGVIKLYCIVLFLLSVRPTYLAIVVFRPTVLAVGSNKGYLDVFSLVYPFFSSFFYYWRRAGID